MVAFDPSVTGGAAAEEAGSAPNLGPTAGTLTGRGQLIRPAVEHSGLSTVVARAGGGASWIDGLQGLAQAVARATPAVRLAALGLLGVAVVIAVFAVGAVMRSGAPSPAPTLADLAAPTDGATVARAGGGTEPSASEVVANADAAGAGGSGAQVGPSSLSASAIASDLTVHVAGGVREPGLVRLPSGARVADALAAAGGEHGADLDRLNLAERVLDGQRIWVPRMGESAAPVPVGLTPVDGAGGSSPRKEGSGATDASDSGPIHLNSADAAGLEELPGVGPATAAAIISYRDEHGPFSSIDDLLEVRGIGPAKLAAMADRLVL